MIVDISAEDPQTPKVARHTCQPHAIPFVYHLSHTAIAYDDLKILGSDLTPLLAAFWSTIPNPLEQSSRIRKAFRARILEMSVVCMADRACCRAAAGVVSAKG